MDIVQGMRGFALGLVLLWPCAASASDGSTAPVSVTEGGSRVVALSGGYVHSCAVTDNGSASCWGNNANGQAPAAGAPALAGPYLSVSSGGGGTCGVKADGSLACWGALTPPTDPGPYLAVSASYAGACALKVGGSVRCWSGLTSPSDPGPYLSVTAGGGHACGLKTDGSLACWGNNGNGQAPAAGAAVLVGPYLAVSAGQYHTCALKADGSVACWGAGLPSDPAPSFPHYGQSAPPDGGAGAYVGITAGYYHSCALKADGTAVCWGDNAYGQSPPAGSAVLQGPYVELSNGWQHSCGLKANGAVVCWGNNGSGQANVPANLQQSASLAFGQIAAGNAHACQVKRDGTAACWGDNSEGQATAPAGLFAQVVAGSGHGCGIEADGSVTCWGRPSSVFFSDAFAFGSGRYRQLALGTQHVVCGLAVSPQWSWCINEAVGHGGIHSARNITSDYASATTSESSLCAVAANGGTYCKRVQSGLATAANAAIPAGPWQRLESGLSHQCGLKLDGTLQCWGDDALGQTDNVPAGTFRAFSVGWNHGCAIRTDGTLACWGSNLNGQATPPAGTYVQVVAGNTFSCAIKSDGVRLCWGDDSHGQAPQLAIGPASIAGGIVGVAHAGATFGLVDASPSANANEAYVPQGAAFAVVSGALPTGLSLSAAGVLSGTPTAGGNFTFTVEGEDANGFVASRSYSVTIIADTTPPDIAYAFNPASPNGSNGWYTGNVGIDWTIGDAQSAITGSTGCDDNANAVTSDTLGATFTCSATSAGGSNSVTTTSIKRDATAPTLAPTVPSPLLRGQGYSASANAGDATSGVASSSCGALDTGSLGSKSTSCSATDNAGNTNTVALNYTVTTTCANDGYKGTQLTWCRNICEMGYTGSTLDIWIHRWTDKYRDLPYCLATQQPTLQ